MGAAGAVGGSHSAGAGGTTSSPANIVFVTAKLHSGSFGGLDGADAFCNEQAADVGLPGTYVAWLSDSTTDAASRLTGARGWVRVDGKPFADTIADVTNERLFWYPIERDESNQLQHIKSWTGTSPDGQMAANEHCNDWQSDSAQDIGTVGSASDIYGTWTAHSKDNCSIQRSLLCFGIDHNTVVDPPQPVSGRYAFTAPVVELPAGRAQFDAACAQQATDAKLPGSYLALISTRQEAATDRFNLDGPTWISVNGIPLLNKASDLAAMGVKFVVGPAHTADGKKAPLYAWLGAEQPNQISSQETDCDDWMNTQHIQGARGVRTHAPGGAWQTPVYCDETNVGVICLQSEE